MQGDVGQAHGRRKDAPRFRGGGGERWMRAGSAPRTILLFCRRDGTDVSQRCMARFFFFSCGRDPVKEGWSQGRRDGRARGGRRGRSVRRLPTGCNGPRGLHAGPGSPVLVPGTCRVRGWLASRTGSSLSLSLFPCLVLPRQEWCGSPRCTISEPDSVRLATPRPCHPSTSHVRFRIVGTSHAFQTRERRRSKSKQIEGEEEEGRRRGLAVHPRCGGISTPPSWWDSGTKGVSNPFLLCFAAVVVDVARLLVHLSSSFLRLAFG